jgi:hypothetical protein
LGGLSMAAVLFRRHPLPVELIPGLRLSGAQYLADVLDIMISQ